MPPNTSTTAITGPGQRLPAVATDLGYDRYHLVDLIQRL
jgi:hypothetical protein